MGAGEQLFDHGGIEHLALDRHPLAQVVEELAVEVDADFGAGLLE